MHHPDPRRRRLRPFAPPIDAVVAAARLELAAESLRAEQLQRGPDDLAPVADPMPLPPVPPPLPRRDDDPPTALLDLAAIRAAVAAAGGPAIPANPASVRWLRGEPEPDPVVEWLPQLAADPEPEPDRGIGCWPPAYPCEVLGNAVHTDGPCGPQHVQAPLFEADSWRRAVLEDRPPVPAPVAPAAPAPLTTAPCDGSNGAAGVPRLTWSSRHDDRSIGYGVRDRLLGSAPLTDRLWPVGPVLDQGAEGACVGCGTADAVNVLRLVAATTDPMLGLPDALTLYHRAQQLDDVPGESYAGTSVLAGMQAGVEAGMFDHYLWAFGTRDVAQTVLQVGPVVVGIPWLAGMYDTGPGGLVQVTGEEVGGHCLVVIGLKMHGPQGQPGPFFVWQNSWGTSYGDGGLGYIHHRDLAQLLHGTGEAAVPVRGRA